MQTILWSEIQHDDVSCGIHLQLSPENEHLTLIKKPRATISFILHCGANNNLQGTASQFRTTSFLATDYKSLSPNSQRSSHQPNEMTIRPVSDENTIPRHQWQRNKTKLCRETTRPHTNTNTTHTTTHNPHNTHNVTRCWMGIQVWRHR